jgi:hypothetical protein
MREGTHWGGEGAEQQGPRQTCIDDLAGLAGPVAR